MTLEEFVKHVGAFYAANIDPLASDFCSSE